MSHYPRNEAMNAVFKSVKALSAHCEINVSIEDIDSSFKLPNGKHDGQLREAIKSLTPVAKQALGLDGDRVTAYGISLHKGGKVIINTQYETPEDGPTTINTPRLTPEHYNFDLNPLVSIVTKLVKAVAKTTNQVSLFEAAQAQSDPE